MLGEAGSSGVNTLGFREVGIMCPANRVFELRAQGFEIRTDWVLPPDATNPRRKIANYVLVSSPVGGVQ